MFVSKLADLEGGLTFRSARARRNNHVWPFSHFFIPKQHRGLGFCNHCWKGRWISLRQSDSWALRILSPISNPDHQTKMVNHYFKWTKAKNLLNLLPWTLERVRHRYFLGEIIRHRLMIYSDGPRMIWELQRLQIKILFLIGKPKTWEANRLNALEGLMRC